MNFVVKWLKLILGRQIQHVSFTTETFPYFRTDGSSFTSYCSPCRCQWSTRRVSAKCLVRTKDGVLTIFHPVLFVSLETFPFVRNFYSTLTESRPFPLIPCPFVSVICNRTIIFLNRVSSKVLVYVLSALSLKYLRKVNKKISWMSKR